MLTRRVRPNGELCVSIPATPMGEDAHVDSLADDRSSGYPGKESCGFYKFDFCQRLAIQEVTFYLTDRCNLKCSFCYERPRRKLPLLTLTPDELERRIDYVFSSPQFDPPPDQKTDDPKPQYFFTLFGGEPLGVPELVEFTIERSLQKAQSLGIQVGFQLATNGTLLTPEIVHFLNQYNVRVMVGLKRGKYRGKDERHGLFHYDNIDLIRGLKNVYFQVVLENDWLSSYAQVVREELIPLVALEGNPSLQLPSQVQTSRTLVRAEAAPVTMSDEELAVYGEQTALLVDTLINEDCNLFVYDLRIRRTIARIACPQETEDLLRVCRGATASACISVEGAIYPCVLLRETERSEDFIMGYVSESPELRPLKPIKYFNDALLFYRKKCLDCDFVEECGLSCPGEFIQSGGWFDSPPDILCQIEKIVYGQCKRAWDNLSSQRQEEIRRWIQATRTWS